METLRCGQPAGMTTNLFSLETVGCVDSQPDCSDMVNREPPSPVDPMVRPTVTFPKWVNRYTLHGVLGTWEALALALALVLVLRIGQQTAIRASAEADVHLNMVGR
jgi:hypothetical protein